MCRITPVSEVRLSEPLKPFPCQIGTFADFGYSVLFILFLYVFAIPFLLRTANYSSAKLKNSKRT